MECLCHELPLGWSIHALALYVHTCPVYHSGLHQWFSQRRQRSWIGYRWWRGAWEKQRLCHFLSNWYRIPSNVWVSLYASRWGCWLLYASLELLGHPSHRLRSAKCDLARLSWSGESALQDYYICGRILGNGQDFLLHEDLWQSITNCNHAYKCVLRSKGVPALFHDSHFYVCDAD